MLLKQISSFRPLFDIKVHSKFHFLGVLLLLAGDISINPGPDLKFAFTNIRSIRNKYTSVSNFILGKEIDVFSMNETWLSPNDTNAFLAEITPQGYRLHNAPRFGRRGGGVAYLVRKALNSHIVSTPSFTSFEHLLISTTIENKTINFLTIYRPPSSVLSKFLEEFGNLLEIIMSLRAQTVTCGDFNVQVDTFCAASKSLLKFFDSWNLIQHINFFTHNCDHTLDLLLTPSDCNFLKSVQKSDVFCDHFCISACLNLSKPEVECHNAVAYRQFHKIDIGNLKSDLLLSELIVHPASDPETLYNQYHETLVDLLNKHAPIKNRKFIPKTQLWMSDELLEAKRLKRQFERLWRKYKTPFFKSRFRRQVNLCNRLAEKAKCQHYSNKISESKGDPKKLWGEINKILHRSNESVLPSQPLAEACENFSQYFVQKIDKIRETFPHTFSATPTTSLPHITCLLRSYLPSFYLSRKMRHANSSDYLLANLVYWILGRLFW